MDKVLRFLIEIKTSLLSAVALVGIVSGYMALAGIPETERIRWLGWLFFGGTTIVLAEVIFRIVIDNRKIGNRDAKDILDSQVFVVTSERKIFEHLYESNESVVKGANEFIVATGSRSRDQKYLSTIEESLTQNGKIGYCRILFGAPKNDIMKKHVNKAIDIINNRAQRTGSRSIVISQVDLDDTVFERFISCSERKAVIALPSIHTSAGYDTALVIESEEICRQLANRVKDYASLPSATRIEAKL